jgi:hypothetical protein
MKTIIKCAWACWIGISPLKVGITSEDWRWWVFVIVTAILAEASFIIAEQKNK